MHWKLNWKCLIINRRRCWWRQIIFIKKKLILRRINLTIKHIINVYPTLAYITIFSGQKKLNYGRIEHLIVLDLRQTFTKRTLKLRNVTWSYNDEKLRLKDIRTIRCKFPTIWISKKNLTPILIFKLSQFWNLNWRKVKTNRNFNRIN